MIYTATVTFNTDRPLSDTERTDLLTSLYYAVESPMDSDGEYADWSIRDLPKITMTIPTEG